MGVGDPLKAPVPVSSETGKCSCKKSKCLKMYCECFTKGLVCGVECGCTDCNNTDNYESQIKQARDEILSRNSLAFVSKVVENNGQKIL